MMPQFHETRMGEVFFTHHMPALIEALNGLGGKQMAVSLIAAGFHAGNGDTTPDAAARKALETFEAIEKGLQD
jgi:hypothetical protein